MNLFSFIVPCPYQEQKSGKMYIHFDLEFDLSEKAIDQKISK